MDNTYIEISSSKLKNNIHNIKSLLNPETKFFAVVKANAYGHGVKNVHDIVDELVDGYAVHSLEEAKTLSGFGTEKPILIMGYVPLENIEDAIRGGYHFVVYNRETLQKIHEAEKKVKTNALYHLKIETGTGRQGIGKKDLEWFLAKITTDNYPMPTGISTHFANIEDTTRHAYAMQQLSRFNDVVQRFKSAGIDIPIKHTACSAAGLLFPNSHFNMVRVGISLYGFWPSRETYLSFVQRNPERVNGFLKPVMTWKTRINQIKEMPKGSYIGYGLSYRTTYDSKIAILPVGYSDGYDRSFSNNGYVLVKGERAPIRGRICMNIIMVDVTHIPEVSLEDEVILIGEQGNEGITADDLASRIDTINYEIVSRINPMIPRYNTD